LFPAKPTLYFKSDIPACSCDGLSKVIKTYTRSIATLGIGEFDARITQTCCSICQQSYESNELRGIVPHQCRFGFDVIVYVGKALFIHHRGDLDIQKSLFKEKNISISEREIAYLGKKFIIYLALCHKEAGNKIKQHMQSKGGYILHVDGTCEGDSPHLISSMDGVSRIVLDSIKAPSENTKQLIPFFKGIKKSYGKPIAVVHDMSSAIIKASETVFPEAKDFICHYHFLRDLGKDLFGLEYNNIRRYLETYKTRAILRKIAKELKIYIEQDNALNDDLKKCLIDKKINSITIGLNPAVQIYLLTTWILEATTQSKGYGFPFDRPHLYFLLRLKKAYPIIKKLKQEMLSFGPKLHLSGLSKVLHDKAMSHTVTLIQEKITVYDNLRKAMQIASPEGTKGLNDEGSGDIKIIEKHVASFRESDKIKKLSSNNIAYKKMIKQIDKYWEKLFADPIQINTEKGVTIIQPQRTNNMMESFFRFHKKGCRKKSGTSSLNKAMKAMLADTPLVKNLSNPEYVEIILNGKESLAARFAEVDVKQVREEIKKKGESERKYPKGMAKIFNIPNLPKLLTKEKAEIRGAPKSNRILRS